MKNKSKTYSNLKDLPKKVILGVGVTDATKENILEYICNSLQNSTKPYYIVTPNPEIIVAANKNSDLKNALNHAKLALNDGVGVGLAAHIMGNSLQERFTGVDLVEKVCEKSNDWPITVGFLGAGPNVAEEAAECLKSRFPSLQIVYVSQEWNKDGFVSPERFPRIHNGLTQRDSIRENQQKNPRESLDVVDILFIAYGAPKQEFWMAEHVGKIPVQIMVGVGGALDQIANPSLRPPRLMQNIGLGWLYRLIRQPWRFRRQLALLEFVGMVGKERVLRSSLRGTK